MRQDVETVLFDLDGTLIDHFQCIYRCYCYAIEKLDLEPVTYETVRATVGGSVRVTMGRLLGQDLAEQGEGLFREHFNEIMLEDLHLLPGAEWLVKELKANNRQTAVFTNKHGENSRKILHHLGLEQYLDDIIGTYDTAWRKPEPEFTQYALERLGANPETTILVGDSPFDIDAAHAGGIRCYAVGTGSHDVDELKKCNPAAEGVYPDLLTFAEEFLNLVEPSQA
ncbi:MAG: HAD family hydrolase [Verrucomicrobiota bacterium]